MAFGYWPERLLHSRGTPRPLFLPVVSALLTAAFAALAFAPLPALLPLTAVAGFAYGEEGAGQACSLHAGSSADGPACKR